ncbi:M3 family metallopeptidase [Candidatus Synechococcus spongiarum]|uniref:oligopeptidase A n=1 Tax=Candidatus Synechococcus spongiarum TaxID=431041 RepID=A0A170TC73_9SYNE|nr:M3 family metallopeptidase [Candidatus Synechococcus spongiarum]CZB19877.1 Oligopeptidase A (EC 3.4.24.70) [Candidatus Synechococcus spongiarum]
MTSTTNPLLLGHGFPPYEQFTPEAIGAGMPELLQHLEAALARHEARLAALEEFTWEQVMDPLHHVEERLRWAWGVVNHLTRVCDSDALRQVHSQQQPAVVEFYNRLGQSQTLYNALRQLQQRHRQGLLPLDGVQQRILTTAVQAMELQGVGLEPEQRQAFNDATTRLAELSTRYSNHVLDATKSWSLLLKEPRQVDGLPESLRELMAAAAREAGHGEATAAAGPWQLGLDLPRYGPFLRCSRQRHLREKAYQGYVSRASAGDTDNHPLIRKILTLRHQQAQRLGYTTWAQVSLVSKMAGSVEEIEQLVEDLRRPSQLAAARELEQLRQLAREMGAPEGEHLQPWDVSYWSEQLRRRRFDLDSEALRPWFPLEQVLAGLFGLCERLFAIHIVPADGEAPTWHRDVRFFRVVDQAQNTPIAAFYLDPYARPGQKRGGAWMDECLVRQRNHQGQVVVPVAYLICNQTPPVNSAPSLMTFMEVETLFHEFGHGLQHMLTTIDHPQAAGLNLVEDDAIELASQFMENWCYDQPTVVAMARHWQTGAPLPEAEFEKISAARTFMAGTAMLRQLGFAQGDLELHARWRPDSQESPEAAWHRIATAMAALPPIAEDATICGFEHLFSGGYAAGYYTYKWSEVLSADAFAAFEEVGLANEAAIRRLGKDYRDTVLSLGGSQPAGEVFRTFRGREPSTEALLRHSGLVGGRN